MSLAIKHTAMYAISIALMRGVSLLMLPFIARYLPTEEFGRLEVISSIAVLASVLAGLGMEDALYRFAGQGKNLNERKHASANIFTLTLVVSFIFVILSYPLSQITSAFVPGNISSYLLFLLLLIIAKEGLIAVPLGWLRMRERALTFCVVTVSRVFIQALLVFIFIKQGKGVEGVLEATLIAAFIQGIILSCLHIKDTGLKLNVILFRKTLIYSLPIVGSSLLAFGLNGFDRWVIAESLDLDAVALYGVAAKFSIAVSLLIQPFGMWWMPRRFIELNAPGGLDKVSHYTTMGLIFLISVVVLVGLSGPVLVNILMPEQYRSSAAFLLGLIVVAALKEAAEFVNIGCLTKDHTHTQFWINVIATVVGCSALVLSIHHYGLWGVIYSLILAQAVRLYLFYHFSQKVLALKYRTKEILLASTFATSILFINVLIPNTTGVLSISYFLIITALLIVSTVFIYSLVKRVDPLTSVNISKALRAFKSKGRNNAIA